MDKPGFILDKIDLSGLNSYRIGGKAKYYVQPNDSSQLIDALKWADELECNRFILGAGTNILFSDRGFDGLIIHLKDFECRLRAPEKDGRWEVGAGTMWTPWVRKTTSMAMGGVEALIGIPGTVGGAVKMNAGAFSQEICQTLLQVEVLTGDLKVKTLTANQIDFGYRKAPGLKNHIILKAWFQLQPGDKKILMKHARDIVNLRRNRQPLKWPSCGSVFKRPEGDFAGRLVEAAGLKGKRAGGAQIAESHANFIVNKGNARANDVLKLIKLAKKRVMDQFGVDLDKEVILVGFTEEELEGA